MSFVQDLGPIFYCLAFLVFAGLLGLRTVFEQRQATEMPVLHPHLPKIDFDNGVFRFHPTPTWVETTTQRIVWANDATTVFGNALFNAARAPDPKVAFEHRISIDVDERTHWFDVKMIPASDTCSLYFATPANAEVQAESARQDFVQTLASTFGQLSTGLAIFDRDRRLVLFNPALLDLSGLGFEALSLQPDLSSFLDCLREKGLVPEPRNYGEWRDELAALEAAAENGSYSELWTLPHGKTLRVIGRPHPNGAIAFLFEDVSQQISSARAFRDQIGRLEAILDQSPSALALFSSTGDMIYSNMAYRLLWGFDPEKSTHTPSIFDATRLWKIKSGPNSAWSDCREFVLQQNERESWSTSIQMRSGTALDMSCRPVVGRMTLVEFAQANRVYAVESPELARFRLSS